MPREKLTELHRAVAAEEGEKVVVSLQIWPDKECFSASEAKLHEDEVLEFSGDVPFDPGRLILGFYNRILTPSQQQPIVE